MRARIVTSLLLALLLAMPARAGIYNAAQPPALPDVTPGGVKALPTLDFYITLDKLISLRGETARATAWECRVVGEAANAAGTGPWMAAILLRDRPALTNNMRSYLELADRRPERLTLADKINLSSYLLQLNDFKGVMDLLQPLAENRELRDPRQFMIFANLGSACQRMGDLNLARRYLSQVGDYWPRDGQAIGLSKEQLAWLREAERYQMRLLLARDAKASDGLDPLFPVQFVGESGEYEAGQLASAQREKLPQQALPVVQQLLFWMPDDMRLYWLMGELLNVQGDVADAWKLLDRCSNTSGFFSPELKRHRQVLDEYLEKQKAKAKAAPPATAWLPDTSKLIAVGAGTGVVIAFLAFLQFREMRRRRQASLR
jgi:hypothetical protein